MTTSQLRTSTFDLRLMPMSDYGLVYVHYRMLQFNWLLVIRLLGNQDRLQLKLKRRCQKEVWLDWA